VDQDFDDFRYLGKTLKNSRKIKSLKIVLLSEGISSAEWETFAESGIDDFLIKPLKPDVILQKLSTFTANSLELEEGEINSDRQS
jgi:hypothetical protein